MRCGRRVRGAAVREESNSCLLGGSTSVAARRRLKSFAVRQSRSDRRIDARQQRVAAA
jgi:hypothetical protein